MPPQRNSPMAKIERSSRRASGGGAGEAIGMDPPTWLPVIEKLISDGCRIQGPRSTEYFEICEDWPRRRDISGETYRAIRRETNTGNESIVALKVAKGGGLLSTTQVWDQEVRLLRRLSLLGRKAISTSSSVSLGAESEAEQVKAADSKTSNSTRFTMELITEFVGGGLNVDPPLRFLVTSPVCWKTLDARIKGVERGYMEKYSETQALRWCWQIACGLSSLEEADIYYNQFCLRHILLTSPGGDVRLVGFDALISDGPEGWDSRQGLFDLGRVLHMTLSCSTDREDDRDYFLNGVEGGSGIRSSAGNSSLLSSSSSSSSSPKPFLAIIPPPVRSIITGLLSSRPSTALPLGLAVDSLASLLQDQEVTTWADSTRRALLRPLEEKWWSLRQQQENSCQKGSEESKSRRSSPGRPAAMKLAQACLDLGEAWEEQGKAYKAIEYYQDAASIGGEEGQAAVMMEAWSRIADVYQGRGEHAKALAVLRKTLEGLERDYNYWEAHSREEEEIWRKSMAMEHLEASTIGVADIRCRIAISLRETGDVQQAMMQLNRAQHELIQVHADKSLSMANVLIGKATVYRQRGEYIESLETYEDALERRRRVVAKEDPELALLLVSMAECYAEKGDTDVALAMLIQAYKRMAESASLEDAALNQQKTATSSSGGTTTSDEEEEDDLQHQTAASSSSTSMLPTRITRHTALDHRAPNRLLMAAALERIGELFKKKEQWEDALMCLKASHERKQAALARAPHPEIANTLSKMADIYEKRGDHRLAATMHRRALEVRRVVLLPTDAKLADSLFGLGNAYQRLKDYPSALGAYEEAETIQRVRGPSVALGDILVNISRPLKALGRDGEALNKLKEAQDLYRSIGVKTCGNRLHIVEDNLRVLTAYVASSHKTQTVIQRKDLPASGLVGREGLLAHHATSTGAKVSSENRRKQGSRRERSDKSACSIQ